MKSDQIVILDKRTNIRVVEVKSGSEKSENILGLFDEDSYREDQIISRRTNKSFKTTPESWLICSLLLPLIARHWQLGGNLA